MSDDSLCTDLLVFYARYFHECDALSCGWYVCQFVENAIHSSETIEKKYDAVLVLCEVLSHIYPNR